MALASKKGKLVLLAGLILSIAVCLVVLKRGQAAGLHGFPLYAIRTATVAASLVGWFVTQSLLGSRRLSGEAIGDGIHELTAPLHRYVATHPRLANAVLIVSSACIDIFGIFLIVAGIFGPTLRPFVALLILFILRQMCQALCALQAPGDMIWRYPGVPSLLVTYNVENDFFFSGHTAIAIVAAVEIARVAPWWVGLLAGTVAFLEAAMVLVLRAHYTMDVFTAAVTAFCAIGLAGWACGMPG